MHSVSHTRNCLIGAALVGSLLFGLAACAPEPGTEAGRTDKDSQEVNPETSWGDQESTADEPKQTDLPASFPTDHFTIPTEVTIDNTGERGTGQWFLVLRAQNVAEAQDWWQNMIDLNDLVVSDEQETAEGGRAATLRSNDIEVQAVTIPRDDGTVLLSYDLQATNV